ncbi:MULTISPECIES: hypothetical protein [Oscillatoriales]|uniref:hypothetical protein n=1 Tax=Oscillatoriales TaxID=1150 RepID=UPI0001D0ED8C|nr:hypothetical protein [Arthrospira platensis]MDF2211518.1 hypothetical protein [Arthrospira platensis NCB002]MDT9185348.1 hypothetical protein [Limnospira sp. PMC 289.06]MDT9295583.1 hypothetical protein [Arthrospira platensis PCC 7345]BAI88444.1 hypothetical protein NIES39_A06060 [Arthrospira platensis NIES-39]
MASGLDSEGFSPQLNDILNHLQNQAQNRFPYNWLRFIDSQQGELLREFIDLFADTITPETQAQIEEFMHQGQGEIGGLGWRILNRLEGMKKERHRFSNAIVNLTKKIKAQKGEPTCKTRKSWQKWNKKKRDSGKLSEISTTKISLTF